MAPESKHQYFSLSGARELGILIYIFGSLQYLGWSINLNPKSIICTSSKYPSVKPY